MRVVYRLGDVIGCPRFDAFLAVSFHCLRGKSDDRFVRKGFHLTHSRHRHVAVHLRHHHVDKCDIDVVGLLQEVQRFLARIDGDDIHLLPFQQRGEGKDVADVVIDDQGFLAGQLAAHRLGAINSGSRGGAILRLRLAQDRRDLLLQPLGRPRVLDDDAFRGLAELDLLFASQILGCVHQ